jgi:hypothetical protein
MLEIVVGSSARFITSTKIRRVHHAEGMSEKLNIGTINWERLMGKVS